MTDNLIWINTLTKAQLKKIDAFLDKMDELVKDRKYKNSPELKNALKKRKVNLEFCREGIHEYVVITRRCRFCNLEKIERN